MDDQHSGPNEDVPSPIDLREPHDAHEWAAQAEGRPHREPFRTRFAELLVEYTAAPRRILEVGAGPGWLAERILRDVHVAEYALLDFSDAMLAMAKHRLGRFSSPRFLCRSFKEPDWHEDFVGPFEAVIAMQAVHELRHKRHHLALFRQVRSIISPGGVFLLADGGPVAGNERSGRLYATAEEEAGWLREAGFHDVRLEATHRYERSVGATSPMYLLSGRVL